MLKMLKTNRIFNFLILALVLAACTTKPILIGQNEMGGRQIASEPTQGLKAFAGQYQRMANNQENFCPKELTLFYVYPDLLQAHFIEFKEAQNLNIKLGKQKNQEARIEANALIYTTKTKKNIILKEKHTHQFILLQENVLEYQYNTKKSGLVCRLKLNTVSAPPISTNPTPVPSQDYNDDQLFKEEALALREQLTRPHFVEALEMQYPDLEKMISNCGLDSNGFACLDGEKNRGGYNFYESFIKIPKKGRFYFTIAGYTQKEKTSFVLIAYNVFANSDKKILVKDIAFYELGENEDYTPAVIEAFKKDSLKQIGKGQVNAQVTAEDLIAKIKQAENTKMIYHLAVAALARDDKKENRSNLILELKNVQSNLSELKNATYQVGFLQLLDSELKTYSNDLMLELAKVYLQSDNQNVAQLAAILLAERNVKEEQVRNLVIAALKNGDYVYRYRGLGALNQIKNGANDEIIILSLLKDGVSSVREKAYYLGITYTLTDEHVPTLAAMVKFNDYATRHNAVSILGKSKLESAILANIAYLGDGVSSVRENAYNNLINKIIPDSAINPLGAYATHSDYASRHNAATILGLNKSSEATLKLIPFLKDGVSSVRENAYNQLVKREIDLAAVELLAKNNTDGDYATRHNSITILSRNFEPAATMALIPYLRDGISSVRENAYNQLVIVKRVIDKAAAELLEKNNTFTDYATRHNSVTILGRNSEEVGTLALIPFLGDGVSSVRENTYNQLVKREITESAVGKLATYKNHHDYASRHNATTILGRSTGETASFALIPFLKDGVSSVRENAYNQLRPRNLTVNCLPYFAETLSFSDYATRHNSATLMAKIVSPQTIAMLEKQLANESVSSVRDALTLSINSIKTKL